MNTYRLIVINEQRPELKHLSPVIAEAVAYHVGRHEVDQTIIIRQQYPYLLLGPQDERLEGIETACDWAEEQGLPVFSRAAGGRAVILDEHSLSFAVIKPCRDITRLKQNYQQMTRGVFSGFRQHGLEVDFAAVPHSYCKGPYDLAWNGRKIAGIAQGIRGGAALMAGMILVDQEPQPVIDFLNHFYQLAGDDLGLKAAAHTNLQEAVGPEYDLARTQRLLVDGFSQEHDLIPTSLTSREIGTAEQLLAQRQLRAAS